MASGDTKTNQYLDIAANGTRADLPSDTCCETRTQTLIRGVAERVIGVEEEVERLENNPDVVDIVATYQDLQNYDTSGLTDKDIIRVLEDSAHNNNSTYYRWNSTTNQFDYIGEAGGSSINVVQTTGTSTTDVMSQKAVTDMVFDNSNTANIAIGGGTTVTSPSGVVVIGDRASGRGVGVAIGSRSSANNSSVAIGDQAISGSDSVIIGEQAYSNSVGSVAIGRSADAGNRNGGTAIGFSAKVGTLHPGSVALGANSICTRPGEVYIGPINTDYGYNNTNYRVLGGVHDGVDAHDATTLGQINTRLGGLTLLPITQTDYDALATKDANTLYVITGA